MWRSILRTAEFDFSTEEMIAVEGNTVYHVIPHYAEGEAESVLDKMRRVMARNLNGQRQRY